MTEKKPKPVLPKCTECGAEMRLSTNVPMLFCTNPDCDQNLMWHGDWEGDIRYHYEAPGFSTPLSDRINPDLDVFDDENEGEY